MWLKTFRQYLPSSQSSPSTAKTIESAEQCCVIALWMLGTAVILFSFFNTTMSWVIPFCLIQSLMSSQVWSVEASSTITILKFLQSRLTMDCRLYSQRKFLALLRVGTTMQKGSSGRPKSYSRDSLSQSFQSHASTAPRSGALVCGSLQLLAASMKAVLAFSFCFRKSVSRYRRYFSTRWQKQLSLLCMCRKSAVVWNRLKPCRTYSASELSFSPEEAFGAASREGTRRLASNASSFTLKAITSPLSFPDSSHFLASLLPQAFSSAALTIQASLNSMTKTIKKSTAATTLTICSYLCILQCQLRASAGILPSMLMLDCVTQPLLFSSFIGQFIKNFIQYPTGQNCLKVSV